ncbi:MAG TPA: methionyl-tRNA formyltransferase [Tepidisphaeraceae bacterium]|jgi:methionyl-tRNA formyltransferase|nr:methionyl-tRNA formyltransferase [Tepidisphaeraceae bacterium]
MPPLKLIFAGSGEFGLPTLQRLTADGHEIVRVFTQPDRPAGRGRKLTPTPIGAFAAGAGLPVVATPNINAEQPVESDAMVVIAFGQKIGDPVIHRPHLGSMNLHASLLPKYRGAAPIHWAILRGETITGNSVIRLAQKMDAGAVLGQSHVTIGDLETTGELHDRLAIDGAPLVAQVLADLATGRTTEQAQDESLATLAPKLSRELAKVDFTQPAGEVARAIRGLYPWPGCRVQLTTRDGQPGATVTLVRALPHASATTSAPGNIDGRGHITTADGTIEIVELQPQGKRPMKLAEFRNGYAWEAGMTVTATI